MILTIINSIDSWSSNPLINISGITMSVLPNNIKWAGQTPLYNIPVCHTHISTCNCHASNPTCTVCKVQKISCR